MRRAVWTGSLIALIAASTFVATAQVGGKPVSGGNPTPGTPQPDPPNLADRITVTGCLRSSPQAVEAPADANTPADTHFVLASAARLEKVPAGTGGSPLAAKASSRTYRLEGLDSQFSPFVNMKVEVSGEIRPSAADGTTATPPTLLVEFVQKLASTCK